MGKNYKIKSVYKNEYKKTVSGTNFVKGDFIPLIVTYTIRLVGGLVFDVGREAILKEFPGRKRVTEGLLADLRGKDGRNLLSQADQSTVTKPKYMK